MATVPKKQSGRDRIASSIRSLFRHEEREASKPQTEQRTAVSPGANSSAKSPDARLAPYREQFRTIGYDELPLRRDAVVGEPKAVVDVAEEIDLDDLGVVLDSADSDNRADRAYAGATIQSRSVASSVESSNTGSTVGFADSARPEEPTSLHSSSGFGNSMNRKTNGEPSVSHNSADKSKFDDDSDDVDTSPEIAVAFDDRGFDGVPFFEEEIFRDAREAAEVHQSRRYAASDVLELRTFVVLDKSLPLSATEQERREFVEKRLWHRLPPGGIRAVRRVDVRRGDDGVLFLNVWCAVPRFEQR